jgi:hypothetical protein
MTKYYRPLQPLPAPKRQKKATKATATAADIRAAAHVGAQRIRADHARQIAASRRRNFS